MEKSIVALIALVLVLSGCTHMRTVDPISESSFPDINRLGQRHSATIILADGRALKGSSLQVTPDSASWLDPVTGRFETATTEEIRTITFVRKGKGALQGVATGVLMGVALGVVIGFSGGDDPPDKCGWFDVLCTELTATEKAKSGGQIGGALGGLLGTLVGASKGKKDIFQFKHPVVRPQMVEAQQQ